MCFESVCTSTRWVWLTLSSPCQLFLVVPSINLSNIKRKMFGKADNQTQCCWVRSKRATSVLCSTPSPPLVVCPLLQESRERPFIQSLAGPEPRTAQIFCPSDLSSIPGKVRYRLSSFVRDKKSFWSSWAVSETLFRSTTASKKFRPRTPGGPIRPSTDRNVEDGSHFIETKDRRRNIFIRDICATLTADHRGTFL